VRGEREREGERKRGEIKSMMHEKSTRLFLPTSLSSPVMMIMKDTRTRAFFQKVSLHKPLSIIKRSMKERERAKRKLVRDPDNRIKLVEENSCVKVHR